MARGKTPIATTISLDGPFFSRDPAKTFRKNVREYMAALAEQGESDVKAQLRQGEAARAPVSRGVGRVSHHVRGRAQSLRGKPWASTAVVSVNNSGWSQAEGIALMAAAAEIESRTRVFKRTTSRLRKLRKTVDLTEGM